MDTHVPETTHIARPSWSGFVENIVLGSRYLLVPLILLLLLGIFTITFDFVRVLVHLADKQALVEHTLNELELLDIMMIANLIWLISAGSFYVFVDDKYPGTSGKKRPRCLTHVSAGILKEKMAGSIIGIASIYLLEVFLHASTAEGKVEWEKIAVMLAIYIAFIIGLLAFCHTNAAVHHNHSDKEGKEKDHEKPSH